MPVPEAKDLDSFNTWLVARCGDIQRHRISDRAVFIGDAMHEEQSHLLPLVDKRFEISDTIYPAIVDGYGRVKVKGNWYSTPLYPGTRATARVWPAHVEVHRDGEFAARTNAATGTGITS